jgi:hypothetical protein
MCITNKEFFANKSSLELAAIAKQANELASMLKQVEPSYELALLNGVKDTSYNTVRFGLVDSFSGEATVTMDNGNVFKCIGHGTQGGPGYISKQGYIEFIPKQGL